MNSTPLLTILLLMFTSNSISLFAQIQITDFQTSSTEGGSDPLQLQKFNDGVLFSAIAGSTGRELYFFDTSATLIKDIFPGPESSMISPLDYKIVTTDQQAFFFANDGENGTQLWTTDGTKTGTIKLTNLKNLRPSELTLVQEQIFFLHHEGTSLSVWKTDGTVNGTVSIVDSFLQVKHADVTKGPRIVGEVNGIFFFASEYFSNPEKKLCRSDGTLEGTFVVDEGIYMTEMIRLNDEIIISGTDQDNRVFLAKSSGTSFETIFATDFSYNSLSNPISFDSATKMGEKLYFMIYLRDNNLQLIIETDGSSEGSNVIFQEIVKDLNPSNLIGLDSRLIFTSDLNNGYALVAFDVVQNETTELFKIPIASSNNRSIYLDVFADHLEPLGTSNIFFATKDIYRSTSTWSIDLQTNSYQQIDDLTSAVDVIEYDNRVLYAGKDDLLGTEVFSAPYGFAETQLKSNINLEYPTELLPPFPKENQIEYIVGNEIEYHIGTYNLSGNEPPELESLDFPSQSQMSIDWHDEFPIAKVLSSDFDTDMWTLDREAKVIHPIYDEGQPIRSLSPILTLHGSRYFIGSVSAADGSSLYKFDQNGLSNIQQLQGNASALTNSLNMASYKEMLYFTDLRDNYEILYRYDNLSKPLPLDSFEAIINITAADDYLLLTIVEGTQIQLLNFNPNDSSYILIDSFPRNSTPNQYYSYDNNTFFTILNGNYSKDLFMTDGKSTNSITTLRPIYKSTPASLTGLASELDFAVFQGDLYYSKYITSTGEELWKTNISSLESELILDINAGIQGSFPNSFYADSQNLYFTAYTPSSGFELWSHDGLKTTLLSDVVPGEFGSAPQIFGIADSKLFFGAKNTRSDRQLWVMGIENTVSTNQHSRSIVNLNIYPNPAFKEIILPLSPSLTTIEIINIRGQVMFEKSFPIPQQIDISNILPGIYFINATDGRKIFSGKFIKL